MVKLPDVQSLGESPVPQSRAPILSPSNPGVAERAAQQTNPAIEHAIAQVVAVGEKIQTRQDAVNRAKAFGQYTDEAETELRRLQTEGDLSSIDVTRGYGQFLKSNMDKMLSQYGGGPGS